MNRRLLLIGGGALGLAAAGFVAAGGQNLFYSALTEETEARLSVTEAHDRASAGEILLVDIRRPDEWAATGSPAPAHRLDMRRDDFTAALLALTGGDPNAPVALICARGVRSSRLSNALAAEGFTQIIDVPEGMLGSAAGPGWIRTGLPLDRS